MANKVLQDIIVAIAAGIAVKILYDRFIEGPGKNLGKSPSLYTPDSLPKGTGMPGEGPLQQIPAVRTPMSNQKEWEDAWWSALEEIDPQALALPGAGNAVKMFMAHSAREVGKLGASMYHFNPGFITTGTGNYFLVGKNKDGTADTTHKYMIFNFPKQGAVYMLDMIRRKWPEAWEAAWTGDTTAYVKGLHGGEPGGYSETTFNGYWPLFDRLYKELGGTLESGLNPSA